MSQWQDNITHAKVERLRLVRTYVVTSTYCQSEAKFCGRTIGSNRLFSAKCIKSTENLSYFSGTKLCINGAMSIRAGRAKLDDVSTISPLSWKSKRRGEIYEIYSPVDISEHWRSGRLNHFEGSVSSLTDSFSSESGHSDSNEWEDRIVRLVIPLDHS